MDRTHYYITLEDAVEGCRVGKDALFKCPVFAYKKVYFSVWALVIEPTEKVWYERLSSEPVGYAFVRCNRLFDEDASGERGVAWFKKYAGLCTRAEAKPFFSGEKLPVPMTGEAYPFAKYYQIKLLVKEGGYHAVWQSLAVLTGVVVDAPLSLGMTALAMTPMAGGCFKVVVDDSRLIRPFPEGSFGGWIDVDSCLGIVTDESAYIQKFDAPNKDKCD